MNGERRQARRYHWLSEGLRSFVDEPHTAIEGPAQGEIVNLTDHRAESSRRRQLDLLASLGPDRILFELSKLDVPSARPRQSADGDLDARLRGHERLGLGREATESPAAQPLLPHLVMPAHHEVRASDVVLRRLHGNLAAAADRGPSDYPELLLTPGVGARTVRALAMVAEVVHGAPCRFTDPARFSFAHGGKDRHPFPVPTRVYDETIRVLKSAVRNARLGREEALGALRRLDTQARDLEARASGPSVDRLVEQELQRSSSYGGRSVFGWEQPSRATVARAGGGSGGRG